MKIYFWSLPFLMLGCFCTKQDLETQLTRQEKDIDTFIGKLTKDTVIYRSAASRVVLKQGIGDTLASGDSVYFYYAAYIFSSAGTNGSLFAAHPPDSVDIKWLLSEWPDDYGSNTVGTGYYFSGLDAGLTGMRTQEHAYILCTSKYGFGNSQMGIIPKMSPLLFELWIDRIVKKEKNITLPL